MLYPETFNLCADLQVRFPPKTESNSQLWWRNDAMNKSYQENVQLLRELIILILIFIKTSKIVWILWDGIILLPLDLGLTCDFSESDFPEAVTLTVSFSWHSDSFFYGTEKQILCLSQILAERNSALWEKTSYFTFKMFLENHRECMRAQDLWSNLKGKWQNSSQCYLQSPDRNPSHNNQS